MYNPSLHTATNKPIGLSGKPVDARSYYYDGATFKYRPYLTTDEVLGYLSSSSDRTGQFSIIINTGGTLSNGVVTGGTNAEWWFKDGPEDSDLIAKGAGGTLEPLEITVADNTQLDGDADSGWYYTIPYIDYSGYGNYPDVRVYRDSKTRIWMDYTNMLSDDIRLPLPDVSEDGHTLFAYLIIITK